MATHAYNHGLVTSMKGAAIEAVKITALDQATCTVSEQSRSNFILSATIASGVVTLTLNLPYPPALVGCWPVVSSDDATTDIITARYDAASYNSTTGTFVINLSNDDDSGAPAAASPSATDELHVLMIFRRYTT